MWFKFCKDFFARYFLSHHKSPSLLYDQNFYGRRRGGGWGGGSSERCLKWGGGVGVIMGSFQKRLKTGGGKSKSCLYGGGGF